jgi:ornithine cyclodeaminase
MIILDDDQINARVDLRALVAHLRAALAEEGCAPARMHVDLPEVGSTLLVMPAWAAGAVGVKVITVSEGNRERGLPTINGQYLLIDGPTGVVDALLSAAALTSLRTAAVSALASDFLSREDAATFLMIGTGQLAQYLVRAHATVRSFDRIVLWGRRREKADAIAGSLRERGLSVSVSTDLISALREADVVCAATSSNAPLITALDVQPGTHIDLVGSFTPEMREAEAELFRGNRLIVDLPVAFEKSGDLLAPVQAGYITATAPELKDMLRDRQLGRQSNAEITIFKAVGNGLADLATAQHLLAEPIFKPELEASELPKSAQNEENQS